MLRERGESGGSVSGEEVVEGRGEEGTEEEDADAREKAELKAEVGGYEGIEEYFDEKGDAKEVETRGVTADEFADEIEHGHEPAALDGGN